MYPHLGLIGCFLLLNSLSCFATINIQPHHLRGVDGKLSKLLVDNSSPYQQVSPWSSFHLSRRTLDVAHSCVSLQSNEGNNATTNMISPVVKHWQESVVNTNVSNNNHPFFLTKRVSTQQQVDNKSSSAEKTEESCLHRQERRFGQNPSFQHSIQIQQLFHEYSAFHRNHTESVNVTEDLLSVNPSYDKADDVKYIYVDAASSGLGNRMNTILTGFLLALYVKRILLVKTTEWDIDAIFCQPFGPGSNWLWPDSLTDVKKTLPQFGYNYLLLRGSGYNVIEEIITGRDHGSYSRYHIWHLSYGEQYMLPMFYLGTDSRKFMEKWFPNRDPAKHLFSFLFHPRDHIWQQIVATYRTIKESADTFTVGLQLRNANKFEEWRCINYDNWPDNTHFFIASLFSGENILLANHEFCQHFNPTWKFTQVFAEGKESHDNDQTAHALHDIWILSMMDESILSPKSTFGYFSMALGGKRFLYPGSSNPEVCSNYYNQRLEEKVCYRAISYEPCYHMHFSYDYLQVNGLTPENMYNNTLVRCEDICFKKDNLLYGWKIMTT